MTRTRRVAGSVALSLVHQVTAMVVGLWLTQFVLDRLGQSDYGIWLIVLQALGWFALTDLGVVALLPRQVALASGAADPADTVSRTIGEATRVVFWQWPLVIAVAAGALLLVPQDSAPVATILVLVFALGFPLRRYAAVLHGLQDIVFLGWLQFASWLLVTALTIVGLLAGMGLHALAMSWGVGFVVPAVAAWWRLRARHRGVLPVARAVVPWSLARKYLSSATWVSLGQLALALTAGSDVLIIGKVLGAPAVVPYALTLKLAVVIGGLPLALASASGPALSQLRASGQQDDLRRAVTALCHAALVAAGALACVIVAVNRGFVGWWVGPEQFGGMRLTVAGIALMLIGQYSAMALYAVYSLGHERRLALTGVAQGAVAGLSGIILVGVIGPIGATVAGIGAALLVALPLTLPTLAAATGTTVTRMLRDIAPFVLRLALALAAAYFLGDAIAPTGPVSLAVTSLAAAAVYAALMLPVARRPPLREYVLQLWRAMLSRLGWTAAPAAAVAPHGDARGQRGRA